MHTKECEDGTVVGVQPWVRRAVAMGLALALAIGAVGCHTVKGAGQDIESAGKKIESSSGK